MTKVRAPISIDTALARIAGQVDGGWEAMAVHVGYQPRTVRAWGDADRDEHISLRAAILLDVLFQQHGGTGAPLYEAHGDMVTAAQAIAFADKLELQRETIAFMQENTDAETALLELSLPDAGPAEEARAQREMLQVRQKADEILTRLGRHPP
ncbi:hypothetical protein [Sphingomonas bisphenolicum]|nr:hypothetical protein [Sphingomonas bisphenolicum]